MPADSKSTTANIGSPPRSPLGSSRLEEGLGDELWDYLFANASQNDIIRLIDYYNFTRPESEHILIALPKYDIEANRHGEKRENEELAALTSDIETLSDQDKIIDNSVETAADATPGSPALVRPPSTPPRDDTPPWLGLGGFEDRTNEWIAMKMSEENHGDARNAEREELRGEALATFISSTIDKSKSNLLEILRQYTEGIHRYTDEVQRGELKVADQVRLVLDGIMAVAKGKGRKVDDDPLEFTTMVEYQKSLLRTAESQEDALMYCWWCYFNQCSVTDTEVDDEVVAAAKGIIAMIGTSAEEEKPEDSVATEATDGVDVKESIVGEDGAGGQPQAGYEALQQVLFEQDKRYPKYAQEILQEASTRSGVKVETILALKSEA